MISFRYILFNFLSSAIRGSQQPNYVWFSYLSHFLDCLVPFSWWHQEPQPKEVTPETKAARAKKLREEITLTDLAFSGPSTHVKLFPCELTYSTYIQITSCS